MHISLNWQKADEQLRDSSDRRDSMCGRDIERSWDCTPCHSLRVWVFQNSSNCTNSPIVRKGIKEDRYSEAEIQEYPPIPGSSVKTFPLLQAEQGEKRNRFQWAAGSSGEKKSRLRVHRDHPVLRTMSLWDLCMHLPWGLSPFQPPRYL